MTEKERSQEDDLFFAGLVILAVGAVLAIAFFFVVRARLRKMRNGSCCSDCSGSCSCCSVGSETKEKQVK